jgi:hypothetical protein
MEWHAAMAAAQIARRENEPIIKGRPGKGGSVTSSLTGKRVWPAGKLVAAASGAVIDLEPTTPPRF